MVTTQVKVGSQAKIVTFRLIGYRDGTNNSCEPKLCQNSSQGMRKVPCKNGRYNKISVVWHVLWFIWDVKFDGEIHFKSDLRKRQYQVDWA